MIKRLLLHICTEPDNKTFCPIRLSAISGLLQHSGHGFWLLHKGTLDIQAWALGFAAILGASGVALGLKKDSTPQ